MQNKAFSMEDLFAFLNAGVSAFHSTAAAAAILEAEGYRNCPESAAWHLVPGGKYYTTRNGSAILAWRMPKGPLTGWHAAASHSDSPTWRIKTLDGADHGFARAEVEGYGGMLMSTWFDRPLSVAGRLLVRTADGVESRLVHPERALACIPNLCIHFNREANTGLNYNPQVDLQPIFGAEGGSLKDTLAAEAGGKAEDILATDLVLCITEKAQRVGLQGEYFMSGRIDDLECAYATLYGFLQGRGEEAGRGDIWVMFDNEEVGSSSRQGAQGSLMSDVLARIEESLGVTKEQSIRARTNCLLLSADNGHATHPNHPEKSDQKLPVNMGGGVILKYNARQTYTTSGLTGAAFTAICEKAGVPVLAKVAASFLPMWPDLPIPETISLPSQWIMVSAARMKSSPRRSGRRLASCSSSIRVWRPASNKKLLMMFSSNNDFNTFGFQRPLEFRVNIGIGNQFIHAFKAADNIGAFTTKLG